MSQIPGCVGTMYIDVAALKLASFWFIEAANFNVSILDCETIYKIMLDLGCNVA